MRTGNVGVQGLDLSSGATIQAAPGAALVLRLCETIPNFAEFGGRVRR